MKKKLALWFPTYGDRNVALFYITSSLHNLWITTVVWLLLMEMYLSDSQIGWFEISAIAIALSFEIPSGAIADLLGRKLSAIVGSGMKTIGTLMYLLGPIDNSLFFIGNAFAFAGGALVSGSIEALVFDSMKARKNEAKFSVVLSKANALNEATRAIAFVVGGLLWLINPFAPWVVKSIAFGMATLISFQFIEVPIQKTKLTLGGISGQSLIGIKHLFTKPLLSKTMFYWAISGTFALWGIGVIRTDMGLRLGLEVTTLSNVSGLALLTSAFVASFWHRVIDRLGFKVAYVGIAFIAGTAWVMASWSTTLVFGALTLLAINISGVLSNTSASIEMNNATSSDKRATVISAFAFLKMLPYPVLVLPYLLLRDSWAREMYLGLGLGLLAIGFGSIWLFEKEEKLNVTEVE